MATTKEEVIRGVNLVRGGGCIRRISIPEPAPKDKPGQVLFSPEEAKMFQLYEGDLRAIISAIGPSLFLYGLSCNGGRGMPTEENTIVSEAIYLYRSPEKPESMGDIKFIGAVKDPRKVFLGLVEVEITTADLVATLDQFVMPGKVMPKLFTAVFTAGKGA